MPKETRVIHLSTHPAFQPVTYEPRSPELIRSPPTHIAASISFDCLRTMCILSKSTEQPSHIASSLPTRSLSIEYLLVNYPPAYLLAYLRTYATDLICCCTLSVIVP